ncbi:BSD domain-containing protein 1 isoform X3 [Arachis ipaensis]|uniref:BSD domain-containing protein 1 isoform X2 n=1 Tax=Arachis ipaensis TaxID=130454 RepID=UPI000A2B0F5C|nr:BSD domain-containing protein 1 isoform X2 [Arachis ipaensis]XP_020959386.1 BSD domain-containing protein 1 isoform X3 [Arachis ipaensis]
MNFFKSILSDDPDPPGSESESDNASHPQNATDPDPSSSDAATATTDHSDGVDGSGWIRFGGLIKTLTSKSESIIETYRRDLQEFGTGLKKEIEVAHGSLETVGQAIDQLGSTVVKGTAQIISQGKEAILAADLDSDNNSNRSTKSPSKDGSSSNLKGYSRFEAQIRAIQGDASTYTDEPEDLEEYGKWKLGFSLEGKDKELEGLLSENEAMESIYKRLVPNSVDNESFWLRYFYKVYKLKKAEDVRARLVTTMSREEEDLSWDVTDVEDDDDEEGGKFGEKGVVETKRLSVEVGGNSSLQSESKEHGNDSVGETKVESSVIAQKADDGSNSCKEVVKEVVESGKNSDYAAGSDEKVIVETKVDDGKPSVVEASKSPAHEEEEDLGWDEIEDLSSIDEKKTSPPRSGSPSKIDVRKRLSVAEEEEDLSWDIEDDDDDAVKS